MTRPSLTANQPNQPNQPSHPNHPADAPTIDHPRTRSHFREIRRLLAAYLVLSVVTLAAIVMMRHDPDRVTSAVWTRGIIVAVGAAITSSIAARAATGSPRAYLRLRLITAITAAAIVVIVALPGDFPIWLKVEQGVCGVLLIRAAAVLNHTHLRSVFAGK
jgi:hypothetical protein